jgi:hypothetical protein
MGLAWCGAAASVRLCAQERTTLRRTRNMALTPCSACSHSISAAARSCPNCGHPNTPAGDTSSGPTLPVAAIALGSFALMLGLSAVMNPSMEDFERHARGEFRTKAGEIADSYVGGFAASAAAGATERTNLGFCSLYRTQFLGYRRLTLGAVGRFVTLEGGPQP